LSVNLKSNLFFEDSKPGFIPKRLLKKEFGNSKSTYANPNRNPIIVAFGRFRFVSKLSTVSNMELVIGMKINPLQVLFSPNKVAEIGAFIFEKKLYLTTNMCRMLLTINEGKMMMICMNILLI